MRLLLAIAVLAGCGRIGYGGDARLDGGDDAGPVGVDARADATADASIDGSGADAGELPAPIFYIDASDVDGTGASGPSSCPGGAASDWRDLVTGTNGNLVNFGIPPCGPAAGWNGDGSAADPDRLTFVEASFHAVPFGTIGNATRYTVEAWIRWTGTGNPTGTGGGGIDLYPIVVKGAAEIEVTEVDATYWLGIHEATGALATDFEDSVTHDNHPLMGSRALPTGQWLHVAVTYDHMAQTLFVDGAVETSRPETDPASLAVDSWLTVGANYDSTGSPDGGWFDGDIAIVRIFDRALTPAEVLAECLAFAPRFAGLACGGGSG